MNKVHTFAILLFLSSSTTFSMEQNKNMDFESMLSNLTMNNDTSIAEEKRNSYLGFSREEDDEQMAKIYLEACHNGETHRACSLLQTSPALLLEAKNEQGENGLQIASNNNQFDTMHALFQKLSNRAEKKNFSTWLIDASKSNPDLDTWLINRGIKKQKKPSTLSRTTSFLKRK